MRSIYFWVVIGSVLALASTVWAAEPGSKQDALLESFFREYLEAAFRLEPMMATRLGDHRFDDQLDDLAAAARKARLDHDRETLAELPAQDQITRNCHATVRSISRSSAITSSARSGWPRHFIRLKTTRASTASI